MALLTGTADPQDERSPLLSCELRPVVDWVSLDVRLPAPSQPRHVMARLKGCGLHMTYALPLEREESCTRFRLRVQDPPGPDAVLQGLHGALGIDEDGIKVHGIEVALDAYVPNGTVDNLVTVAAHMLWGTATPPAGRLWITGEGKGNSRPADKLKPMEVRQYLAGPYSGNMGKPSTDSTGMRIYVKRSDSPINAPDDKPRTTLPPDQQRARLERWFQRTAVPFNAPTLAGWRAFRFEDLTKHFAQVRIRPAASGITRVILEQRTVQLGQPDDDKARKGHRRMGRPGVVRDSKTNEAIRVALRRLTTSQRHGTLPNT